MMLKADLPGIARHRLHTDCDPLRVHLREPPGDAAPPVSPAPAQLCIERTTPPPPATDEQLVALCQRIAAAQQQEAETL